MRNNTTVRSRLTRVLTLLIAFTLVAAACGDDGETSTSDDDTASADDTAGDDTAGDDTAGDDTAGDDTGPLEGDYLISGSSTVFPIVQRQAEQFQSIEPGVAIAVQGPGSGDGAKLFCDGDVPIANASRLYKDEEIAICEENGIEFIELRRGIDGISVVTSADNDAVECVSFNDLYALLSEEALGNDNWADANELTTTWGGQEFPDATLDIFGPGEESGTFDSFTEIVIESVYKGATGLDVDSREFAEAIRADYTSSPDDNIIIEGIADAQYSLGWVGYAYAQEAVDAGDVSFLAVSKEDGGVCVTPTPETIASADFPISRFLYTYVNADAAANDPSVAAFVDYMMSDEGLESVTAVGYIDLAEADQALAQGIWANRTTGRQWG